MTAAGQAQLNGAAGMGRRGWLRAGLVVFALAQATLGCWALGWPRSFYADMPLAGHGWVALLPPYNEHLLRDYGGLSLALAVVLAGAAIVLEQRLVRVALSGYLTATVAHLVFHAVHLEHFDALDAAAQTAALAVFVVGPLALLALTAVPRAAASRTAASHGPFEGDDDEGSGCRCLRGVGPHPACARYDTGRDVQLWTTSQARALGVPRRKDR